MGFILNNKVSQGGVGDGGFLNLNVSSGPSYDPDASAYFTAVAAAGGTITGSVSSGNKKAFNEAFISLKYTNSSVSGKKLWDLIKQGYFLLGQEENPDQAGTLASDALFVPFKGSLYSGIGTNWFFTQYSKTGGLSADGNALCIDTHAPNNFSDPKHGYAYVTGTDGSVGGIFGPLWGTAIIPSTFPDDQPTFGDQYDFSFGGFRHSLGNILSGGSCQFSNKLFDEVDLNLDVSRPTSSDGGWGILNTNATVGDPLLKLGSTKSARYFTFKTLLNASTNNNNTIQLMLGTANYGSNQNNSGSVLAYSFGDAMASSDFDALDAIILQLKNSIV